MNWDLQFLTETLLCCAALLSHGSSEGPISCISFNRNGRRSQHMKFITLPFPIKKLKWQYLIFWDTIQVNPE